MATKCNYCGHPADKHEGGCNVGGCFCTKAHEQVRDNDTLLVESAERMKEVARQLIRNGVRFDAHPLDTGGQEWSVHTTHAAADHLAWNGYGKLTDEG
jgi:hypothetical protein